MATLHVRPAPGLKIRDPDLRDFLPDNGRVVPATGYWRRRLRDGDVQRFTAPGKPATRRPDAPQGASRPASGVPAAPG